MKQTVKKINVTLVFMVTLFTTSITWSADVSMMSYINKLDTKTKTTIDDGLIMVLYLNGKTLPANFAGRLSYAKKQGFVPDSYNKKGEDRLTRGDISLMLARYLKLEGSFFYWLFEGRRYSYRLLVYHDLMPALKSEWDNVSGEELVEVIRLADEYKKKQN